MEGADESIWVVAFSVTRFGVILALCQIFKNVGQFLMLVLSRKIFEHTLENCLRY